MNIILLMRNILQQTALGIGLCITVLVHSGCGNGHTESREENHSETPPNIVIIYADDMGYGDLSIQYPESKIKTPHLDGLAKEGLLFTDGHSSSGVCSPSRYAILTGRYHWRQLRDIVHSFGPPVFDTGRLTLPAMLRENGYYTGCIGKWHLGWQWNFKNPPSGKTAAGKSYYKAEDFDWGLPIKGGPLSQGFDYYFGDDVPNFPPYTFIENEKVLDVPVEDFISTETMAEGKVECRPGPGVKNWVLEKVMPTITEKAVTWIASQKGNQHPFFLYFALTAPHAPIVPGPAFKGKSGVGGYGDFVVQSDWSAGEILRALDKNGFTDNTIVIFTSDNGPEYFAYDRDRNTGHKSSGPLRGIKRDLWEGGHRVPFIVRWPKVIQPGRVSSQMVSQVDLMATFADLLGYQLPAGAAEDSYSMRSLLEDRQEGSYGRQTLIHHTFQDYFAIRKEDWVLIASGPGTRRQPEPDWYREKYGYPLPSGEGELYNLETDPGEKNNLYHQNPEMVLQLSAELQQAVHTAGQASGARTPDPGHK